MSGNGYGAETVSKHDYPLSVERPELLCTFTGKEFTKITMKNVLDGTVTAEDLRISGKTLELQAQIAEDSGRPQLAENLRRAAELTQLGDEEVLQIYNALRPGGSNMQQLLAIAQGLENRQATRCAALVREAAEVYERRRVFGA